MNNDSKNFLLAIALSFAVMLGWQVFVIDPQTEQQQATAPSEALPRGLDTPEAPIADTLGGIADDLATTAPTGRASEPINPIATAPATTTIRVPIQSETLLGSLRLSGARLDDLQLQKYPVSLEDGAPAVRFLQPEDTGKGWFAQFGWINKPGQQHALPDDSSQWQVIQGTMLTPATPVLLQWENGEGLVFEREIALDDDYLFTITDRIHNRSDTAAGFYPYAQITRSGEPAGQAFFVIHEGGVGVMGDDGLVEYSYSEMQDEPLIRTQANKGWIGLTDKYWASILVPPQGPSWRARFSSTPAPNATVYRTDYLLPITQLSANDRASITHRLFAGAKSVQVIDTYREAQAIHRFDLLIDWGWFAFLTKPLFILLAWFYKLAGNYGLAILLATVVIRLLFYPLANRAFIAMAQMKKLQPQLVQLRERYPDDRMRQQQELMKLYRETKVNPLAGCLPILLQIPVFFALYKVLFVTLDMRHQPFFGWIKDLSAPDPTSLFNLFGLLPFDTPGFLTIGIWPIVMGITMFVQMQMNPPPPDPVQQRIFQLMPLVFTFILAGFPAGLIIYWAWNNILSCLQQGLIMRRHGVDITLWDNLGLKKTGKSDITKTS